MQGAPKKNLWPKLFSKCAPLRATSSGKNTMRSGAHSQEQNPGWPNPGLYREDRSSESLQFFTTSVSPTAPERLCGRFVCAALP